MQMQKLQFVKNLVVEKANYVLEDESGLRLDLVVDYGNNWFKLTEDLVDLNSDFYKEAQRFSQGLLARKHGANLAAREQYL